jgi:AbrB family looped-hinge helix DNA binding protein
MKEGVLAAVRDGIIYGTIAAMNTTIDSAGRLVIPQEIRREAGLRPGMPVEVRWRAGRIEIEPLPLPVKLVRRGKLLVAVPEGAARGALAAETVERTRRTLRRERGPRA